VACWGVRAKLEDIAGSLELRLDGAACDRLMELTRLWRAYAPAINLIGAHDEDELLAHVADGFVTVACAAAAAPVDENASWIDVGSGAGLPGLVVTAVTDCQVVLLEPRHRRAAFLELALATIGRTATVSRSRIDKKTWSENHSERANMPDIRQYSFASARAVFEAKRWMELGEKLVTDGGVLLAHLRPEQDGEELGPLVASRNWGRSQVCGYRMR
jgi:16S rRNA G527 N7-methylase RsmG